MLKYRQKRWISRWLNKEKKRRNSRRKNIKRRKLERRPIKYFFHIYLFLIKYNNIILL